MTMPVESVVIPTPYGSVPARVYDARSSREVADPAIVWSHGGAWMAGSIDMPEADRVARCFAEVIGGVAVSVDYTLVPHARHPQPVEEVLAVFEWVTARAGELGIDVSRIAIGGASAGAHLSTCAALVLRDSGRAPAAIVLVYPVVDAVDGPYEPRPEDVPAELWLGQVETSGFFANYTQGVDLDATPIPAVPMHADLAGLPPVLVTTAGRDGLRPQAELFVKRLADAGVEVELHEEPRKFHGYANVVSDSCDAAVARHADWLRSQLAR